MSRVRLEWPPSSPATPPGSLRMDLERAAPEWQPDSPRCILVANRESATVHTYLHWGGNMTHWHSRWLKRSVLSFWPGRWCWWRARRAASHRRAARPRRRLVRGGSAGQQPTGSAAPAATGSPIVIGGVGDSPTPSATNPWRSTPTRPGSTRSTRSGGINGHPVKFIWFDTKSNPG